MHTRPSTINQAVKGVYHKACGLQNPKCVCITLLKTLFSGQRRMPFGIRSLPNVTRQVGSLGLALLKHAMKAKDTITYLQVYSFHRHPHHPLSKSWKELAPYCTTLELQDAAILHSPTWRHCRHISAEFSRRHARTCRRRSLSRFECVGRQSRRLSHH